MKTLIAYFSWSGNTKKIVDGINAKFNFDTVQIERKIAYSDDYDTCAYVEAKEEVEKHIHPEIKDLKIDVENYDQILLLFPIWWYTFPMPVGTFVEKNLKNFKGKITVFANSYTNDPQYMVNSMRDLKKINPNLNFQEGLFNKSEKDHIKFIEKL